MTYETSQRQSADPKQKPPSAKPKGSIRTVLDTLGVASKETRAVERYLSAGPPEAVIGHVQTVFDPVPVTERRLRGLTQLTANMASELERVKAYDKPGDIAIKIEDEEGPLAAFHHTREPQNNNRDTLLIYPGFFRLGRPGQIYTLVHEAAHAAQPAEDLDLYSWTRLFKALKGHPAQLRNPDAVAYFVRMMYSSGVATTPPGAKEKAPAVVPLTADAPELGQERGPSDLIDYRLPDADRKFIAFALAVAEAKLLADRDMTEPRDGVQTTDERSARYELTSTILGEVFAKPIEVMTDGKNPWRSVAQLPFLLEIPRSDYQRHARGWQGRPLARDVHKLADRIIERLVRQVSPGVSARQTRLLIEEINQSFARDPKGQSSAIASYGLLAGG